MRYLFVFVFMASTAYGSSVTNGVNGINSTVTGLTGAGIRVGQYEDNRPGKAMYDNAGNSASNTKPTKVYFFNLNDEADEDLAGDISDHATEVAGVIIGNSDAGALFKGVAPEAELYSYANETSDDFTSSNAINRLLLKHTNIKAMNLSWGRDANLIENMDGHSHISQYVDWAVRKYDTTFVVSWGNTSSHLARTPQDNFNGITVAATTQADFSGDYAYYWSSNAVYGGIQNDDRILIDLVAPGAYMDILGTGNVNDNLGESGTSFAAPHVTGAVALLQQHIVNRQNVGWPRMTNEAKGHLVMKANLLNSAAKVSGINGAKMTVCTTFANPCVDWRGGAAYGDPFTSLDPRLGAGQLNVEQAVKQYDAGNYDPGEMIPKSGWDQGISGFGDASYDFGPQLSAGDWVSITLVWDRVMVPSNGSTYEYGDQFDPWNVTSDNMMNLDLYLESRTSGVAPTVLAKSYSFNDNVEHLFFEILNTDDYRIRIQNLGGDDGFGSYGLSWWIGNGGSSSSPPGDYDQDGEVDTQDFDVWKSNFGTNFADADGNGNGTVDAGDYTVWRDNLGAGAGSGSLASVPEPASGMLLIAASLSLAIFTRSPSRSQAAVAA